MVIFHSYVSLPEGIYFPWAVFIQSNIRKGYLVYFASQSWNSWSLLTKSWGGSCPYVEILYQLMGNYILHPKPPKVYLYPHNITLQANFLKLHHFHVISEVPVFHCSHAKKGYWWPMRPASCSSTATMARCCGSSISVWFFGWPTWDTCSLQHTRKGTSMENIGQLW